MTPFEHYAFMALLGIACLAAARGYAWATKPRTDTLMQEYEELERGHRK